VPSHTAIPAAIDPARPVIRRAAAIDSRIAANPQNAEPNATAATYGFEKPSTATSRPAARITRAAASPMA
jgi:hypothetical protein